MSNSNVVEPNPGKKKIFYGWWVIVGCMCIYAIGSLTGTIPSIYFSALSADLGWTPTDLGVVASVANYVMIAANLIVGFVIDKIGVRKGFIIAVCLVSVGIALATTATTLTQFVIYFSVITKLGNTFQFAIPTIMVARKWFVKRAGMATGMIMSLTALLSISLYPFLGAIALSSVGWQNTVRVTAVVCEVLVIILGIFVIRDSPDKMGLNPDGLSDEEFQKIVSPSEKGKKTGSMASMTLPQTLKTPQFWMVVFGMAFGSMALSGITVQAPAIVLAVGVPAVAAATAMGATTLPSLFARLGGGIISDKIGKRRSILCFSAATAFACTFGWLFAKTPTTTYVFLVFYGLFAMGSVTIAIPLLGDLFGTKSLGKISGVWTICSGLITGGGSYVAGVIYEKTNSFSTFFLICIGCFLMQATIISLIKPTSVEKQNMALIRGTNQDTIEQKP
jgi:MFS family permease